MKVYEISDNTAQHVIFEIGKRRLVVVGYTDNCYAQLCDVDSEGNNRRITEDYVLNRPNARYDDSKRWIRYRFLRVCTLPFEVNYRWKGSDKVFKIKPTLWIRLNKVNDSY